MPDNKQLTPEEEKKERVNNYLNDFKNKKQWLNVSLKNSDEEIMTEYDKLLPKVEETKTHRLNIIRKILSDAGVKKLDWIGSSIDYYFCDRWFRAMKISEIRKKDNAFMDVLRQSDPSIVTSDEKKFFYLYNAYTESLVGKYDEQWKTDLRNAVIFNPTIYGQSEEDFENELELLDACLENEQAIMRESLLVEADNKLITALKKLGQRAANIGTKIVSKSTNNLINKIDNKQTPEQDISQEVTQKVTASPGMSAEQKIKSIFLDGSKVRTYAEIRNLYNDDANYRQLFSNKKSKAVQSSIARTEKRDLITGASKLNDNKKLELFNRLLSNKDLSDKVGELLYAINNQKE